MHSSPDKENRDDSESLFDFLSDDGERPADQPSINDQSAHNARNDSIGAQNRRMAAGGDTKPEKPFPIIRKPVCVSETGPLKPPRPGDPVEPPPALTDGIRKSEIPSAPSRFAQDADDVRRQVNLDELDVDFSTAEDDWPSSDTWTDLSYRPPMPADYPPARSGLARKAGYLLAFALIATGVGYALIGIPEVRQWTDSTIASVKGTISGISDDFSQGETLTNNPSVNDPDLAPPQDSQLSGNATFAPSAPDPNRPKSLNELFREELAQLEALLEAGSLDEAEQAIGTMDRSVYGYGAPEFTEIKERIASLRQGNVEVPQPQDSAPENAPSEQQIAQQEASQLEQEEFARAEQQAIEAAQAELDQQQRAEELAAEELRLAELAAEEQRAAEQRAAELAAEQRAAELAAAEQRAAELAAEEQRVAEQRAAEIAAEEQRAAAETARLEAERIEQQRADEEAERAAIQQAELDRAAAEAAQIRADRNAQERARQEQLELVLRERIQSDQSQNAEDTDALSVQQLAARQREAARQQRLVEARQRAEQTAGSQPPSSPSAQSAPQQPTAVPAPDEAVVALAELAAEPAVQSSRPAPITDADLQQVYGQFAQLQNAIESRDINTVIALTERSGVRIQQVMQMFENNVAITARLRNVSTLDAAGEIQGTLQITRLERADGAVTGPPLNFSSVRLSSKRDGDGWSSISW